MSKTTTSITLDSKIINAYREQKPDGNLSAFVEETLRKEIGDSLSIEEVKRKMVEADNEADYWREKYFDMAHSLAKEKKLSHQSQVDEAEAEAQRYRDRIQGYIDKHKTIKEFAKWMELINTDIKTASSDDKLDEVQNALIEKGGRLGIKNLEEIIKYMSSLTDD
jgi:hypothetical protein